MVNTILYPLSRDLRTASRLNFHKARLA